MLAKTFVLAVAAATLATVTLAPAPARAGDPAAAVAAGAAGLIGGLILGNALAEPEPLIVRRRPVRIVEDEEVVVTRRCWREVWYDSWGDRHVRRLCR